MTPPVVTIRRVEDGDLPIFYAHQSDPIANAMAVVPARDRASFDAHWVKIRAYDTGLARTIVVDGAVVGMILSWSMVRIGGSVPGPPASTGAGATPAVRSRCWSRRSLTDRSSP